MKKMSIMVIVFLFVFMMNDRMVLARLRPVITDASIQNLDGSIIYPNGSTFNWSKNPNTFIYLFTSFNYDDALAIETFKNTNTGKEYKIIIEDGSEQDLAPEPRIVKNLFLNWTDQDGGYVYDNFNNLTWIPIEKEDRNGYWEWTARGYCPNKTICGNFNVVPEPISSVLFLFGGLALGINQYKKRNKDTI